MWESGLNPNAVSSSDALGLMQKRPKTAEHLGITQRNDLFQPCKNIEAGSRYLKELVDRFESEMTASPRIILVRPPLIENEKSH